MGTSTNDGLQNLDPIFNAPMGPSPAVAVPKTQTTADTKRKPVVPQLGLTPEQESYAAAGVGAVAGPAVQRGLEKLFPSAAMRTQEAMRNLEEQARLQKLLRNLQDERLLELGINPEDVRMRGMNTSGTNWIRNWGGINREIAGGVPEAAATYNRMKGRGPVMQNYTKQWGPIPAGEPGQPHESLLERQFKSSAAAEEQAAQRARGLQSATSSAEAALAEARPGPLSGVAKMLRSPLVQGPLAGGMAGLSFYEAYQRFLEGDRSGAVIDALGGAGAIMSMIPGLQAPGLGLSGLTLPAKFVKEGLENPETRRGISEVPVNVLGDPTGE